MLINDVMLFNYVKFVIFFYLIMYVNNIFLENFWIVYSYVVDLFELWVLIYRWFIVYLVLKLFIF